MKTFACFFIIISLGFSFVSAEQWTGEGTEGTIWRNGSVGIGTATPRFQFDVKGRIKSSNGAWIGLEDNGGGQLIFANNPGDDMIYIEGFSGDLKRSAKEIIVSGIYAKNIGRFTIRADNSYIRGNLGLGIGTARAVLDVYGEAIVEKSLMVNDRVFTTNGLEVGLQDKGGGRLVFTCNDNDNRVYIEGFSTDKTKSADEILITGIVSTELPQFTVKAQKTFISGSMGIGTQPVDTYALVAEGKIGAREIQVHAASWPDYVFADEYELMPLHELNLYIQAEKHLPGLPLAEEVAQNGIMLGQIQQKTVEKIEELTLYVIEQEERIVRLEAELGALRTIIESIMNQSFED
ncbi:MAG: hypothetical protein JW702_11730 [Clostridiales bacterium]|nr:hypothetical protein [Clostridiales bacterium]